jgi:Uma2 family endonuclease
MSAVELRRHRWTRDEYALLYESDLRCELIEGEIIDMSPVKPRHIAVTGLLAARLAKMLDLESFAVASQSPVVLSNESEPEPDVWVATGSFKSFGARKAEPADLLLVVEVADTTLLYDRNVKMPLYARSGVAVSWLIDVHANTITVFTNPVDGTYADVAELHAGDAVSLPWGGTLNVSDVLLLDDMPG